MTEQDPGKEEDLAPASKPMDRKTLAIALAFGLVLALLIALNMN